MPHESFNYLHCIQWTVLYIIMTPHVLPGAVCVLMFVILEKDATAWAGLELLPYL
jgi:tryptophan-rich sensory protein